jgi:hypothetical protein
MLGVELVKDRDSKVGVTARHSTSQHGVVVTVRQAGRQLSRGWSCA